MPDARCTRGLVCKKTIASAHEHTGTVGASRHSLHNGFTAYAEFSPATNSSCHRHRRIKGFVAPGWACENLRRFDTSNGCQDHTVLPSAKAPSVCVSSIARRSCRPALPSRFTPGAAASTTSHPNVRDDRDTPLVGDEMAGFLELIWDWREGEYFYRRDWTGQITLNRFNKIVPPCRSDRSMTAECTTSTLGNGE